MKLTCTTAVFNAIKAGNRERLIRCVESVAKLKSSHEHLIYDGASTDGTVELLRELEAKTPGLKVVSERDTGIYNALNKGVRDARGQWFAVLGCDDYYSNPEVLDNVLDTMADETKLVMSRVDDSNGHCFFSKPKDLRFIFGCCPCAHMGMLMDTKLVREFEGFDEQFKIGADQDLFLRLLLSGAAFRVVYERFAIFTVGGTSYQNQELGKRDIVTIFKNNLHLTDRQVELFVKRRYQSPFVMIKYLKSDNWICRQGARYMLWAMAMHYIWIVLYPAIAFRHIIRGDFEQWKNVRK